MFSSSQAFLSSLNLNNQSNLMVILSAQDY